MSPCTAWNISALFRELEACRCKNQNVDNIKRASDDIFSCSSNLNNHGECKYIWYVKMLCSSSGTQTMTRLF